MSRVRAGRMPAAAKAWRAARWCSDSTSMVVSTPSGVIPPSSHSALTPVPVPDLGHRVRPAGGGEHRAARRPSPAETGVTPSSAARSRASAMASSSGTNSSV